MALRHKLVPVVALTGALALTAAACGGGDGDDGDGQTGSGQGAVGDNYTGGEVRTNLTEPEALLNTDTTESEGASVLQGLYRTLVRANPETGENELVVAESIEPDEQNQVWTITVEDGWEFHNGEPVDADAFIRGWNYGAYGPNAQNGNEFFQRIEGYADMQEEGGETELAGLNKVDERTFEVTLSSPFAGFDVTLAHNAFAPMAQECHDDPAACNEAPIGNGPFQMDGEWEHDTEIRLTRFENYAGDDPANIDNLTFNISDDVETDYNEIQAQNLDLVRSVPPDRREEARDLFGDRFIEEPTSSYSYLGLPLYDETFQDPRVRQAISLSINREQIIDQILLGAQVPATSVVAPMIEGHNEGACNYCEHDPEQAQQLLDEAGGWPDDEPLQLYYNPGSGHDDWVEAVGNQIQNTLGIEYEMRSDLQWSEYLTALDEEEMDGPFRLGWQMSYNLPEYYLNPLYTTNGSANYFAHENEEFDQTMQQADEADTVEESLEGYEEAEQVLMEELPAIPLWYGMSSVAYNENVDNVTYNVYQNNPIWTEITVQ